MDLFLILEQRLTDLLIAPSGPAIHQAIHQAIGSAATLGLVDLAAALTAALLTDPNREGVAQIAATSLAEARRLIGVANDGDTALTVAGASPKHVVVKPAE